ncbi:recombinase family protein [Rhizobium sp. RHZ02]|uniref:recombinase family protein n=1 Tax=Rhizobium sp. RHZ02 TaxID=2769306 RepID=UPI0017869E80|nr:recombinase family protein [Rhizobium sp. RHZ02]MBD9453665.1 recombinase family protein [Rhizobium sp. RHZ02]
MNAEPSCLDFALTEKIQSGHHDRQAIVYVRQSTVRQVEHNRESTRLQYALADRACRLGWRRDQITVIDDDLGRSGASTLDRPGFQRLVAEVGLGHVGMVIGIEVSRLARSCRDWHQLLEMCALFDTLIGDADGVYDPSTYNDRLLLGLKGTMSEAELHILKSRMHEGRKAKARRGELILGLPRGYVLKPSGEVALDPDEEVQRIIRLVFAVFERRRSISGVLRYLVDHDIALPDRIRSGPEKGDVCWNRPNNATIGDMLRHPTYAGAYVYGRSHSDGRLRLPGKPHSGRRIIGDRQKWMVLHQNALPAYIDWKTYEQNQDQMAKNRTRYPGVPRGGAALLSGLVSCGVCGRKMVTGYNDDGREARYSCSWEATTYGGRHCQSISARPVDARVSALVLEAVSPSAIDVSLQVAEDIELERQQIHDGWKQRLERADYEVALARRRYEAVDPDNRLVARTLEKDWETALAKRQTFVDDHQRTLSKQPERLTEEEKEVIRHLAEDVPSLWTAESTSALDRQTIARIMLDRVVIQVFGETERAEIKCHWAGGIITTHPIIRTVRRFEQLEHHDEILARITALRDQGATAQQIADNLNAQGWSPAKKSRFDALIVQKLLVRKGLGKKRPIWSGHIPRRNDDEVTLQELSEKLGIHRQTAYGWLRRGKLRGRIVEVGTQRIWLVSLSQASTGTCTGESS